MFNTQRVRRGGIWVEYGWNYMKFHPNFTPNSTIRNSLIIRGMTTPRWKGGITNEKKYFSENRGEKVLTTVKYYYLQKFRKWLTCY